MLAPGIHRIGSCLLHKGPPEEREKPEYLRSLGRSMAFGMNGSISNNSRSPARWPDAPRAPRGPPRRGARPRAPRPDPDRLGRDLRPADAPVVGRSTHTRPRLSRTTSPASPARAAGSTSLRQDRGLRGRRVDRPPLVRGNYEIVPNGSTSTPPAGPDPTSAELVLFVGRAEERKGLPVLLPAFEAPGRARSRTPPDRRRHRPRATSSATSPTRTRYAHIEALGGVYTTELWRGQVPGPTCCARRRFRARGFGWS